MNLSEDQIAQVAHLARLDIDDSHRARYSKELSRILDMVDELGRADVGDAQPMAHPFEMVQRLRADAVTETDERDRFQAQAPSVEGGLYLVPRVIE